MLQGGDVLDGKYTLSKLVGEGSVGAVWQAIQSDLKRKVALKVIRDDLDDPALADLKHEAEIQASLNHPGITIVHDFVQTDDVCFIVMEYLDGRNLEEILQERPAGLPEASVLSMATEIADALSAAHRLGLVHRDLKPANLFLEHNGRIKICDFGIAVAAADSGNVASASGYLTGTPQYMSPEQCDGISVDVRSDLYSLGCVLYELLTGRPPFGGKPEQVMASHRAKQPVQPRLFRPEIAVELDELVMRLLSKDRQDRPSDAGDVVVELREISRRSEANHAPASSSTSTLNLSDLLRDPRYRELLGLLAVMPDGLYLGEIEYLTGQADLSSQQIKDIFRRTEKGIFSWDEQVAAERAVYRLASQNLRGEVTATLGAGLIRGHYDRLHEWADECRSNGWPEKTPACLLVSYTKVLSETRDINRLARCATDAARHDLMFKVNGGDADALAEIGAAQEALATRQYPDLRAIAELAVHRDQLIGRDAAARTAAGMGRDDELAELAVALVMAGYRDESEQVRSCIRNEQARSKARAGIAFVTEIGYFREKTRTPGGRAAEIASACLSSGYTAEASIAATAAISVYIRRPLQGTLPEIIRRLPRQYRRQAIQAVATAHAFARRDPNYERAKALKRDTRSALTYIFLGWQMIGISGCSENDKRCAHLALKIAASGSYPLADANAHRIVHPELRNTVLADIALGHAIMGHGSRGLKVARAIRSPQVRLRSAQEICISLAATGQFDAAINGIAAPMTDQQSRDQTLAQVALVCALALGHPQAVRAAIWISDPRLRALTLATAISEMYMTNAGDALRLASQELAKVVSGPTGPARFQSRVLAESDDYALVTSALMTAGRNDVAARVASESQAFANALPAGTQQVRALACAASTLNKIPEMQLIANRGLLRSLVALALTKGPWPLSLKALRDVDRDILPHIAALLISHHQS
jgi:serine/threonine protein kinase